EDIELPNNDHQDDPSIPRPPPEPPDVEKCFEPEAGLTFISSFFSFGSEDTVFDPGIVTFHKPVAVSMKVSCSKYCSP
ncbi:hypothetical protein Tco_1323189, partial [Tanacetum coccineum]